MENLLIYKANYDLICYTEMIVKKFPKCEKSFLVKDIRGLCIDNQKYIIKIYREISKNKKFYYLNELDSNLKILKLLIRLSYRNKYIGPKNYGAWSRKITNVNNMMLAWMNSVKND